MLLQSNSTNSSLLVDPCLLQLDLCSGDNAWILTSTALVLLMTPGIAFFYGGLATRKAHISTLWMSFVCMGLILVQWALFGYSLAYENSTSYIGSLSWGPFFDSSFTSSKSNLYSKVFPVLLHFSFQGAFAVVTPAIISGAVVGRVNLLPYLLFQFLWSTAIYDIIVHWVWSESGWLNKLGVLDFAGGSVVHLAAGTSAFAFAIYLKYFSQTSLAAVKPRLTETREKTMATVELSAATNMTTTIAEMAAAPHKTITPVELAAAPHKTMTAVETAVECAPNESKSPPHNDSRTTDASATHQVKQRFIYTVCCTNHSNEAQKTSVPRVLLGTMLMWFGWAGFNAGSQSSADAVAAIALANTMITPAAVMIVWHCCEMWLGIEVLLSSSCFSAIFGLVLITPASGYISPFYALITGLVGGFSGFWLGKSPSLPLSS
jgi:ammonia channel protein AmtB